LKISQRIIYTLIFLSLPSILFGQASEKLKNKTHLNVLNKGIGLFSYFTVIKVKNRETGTIREICTEGKKLYIMHKLNKFQKNDPDSFDIENRYMELKNEKSIQGFIGCTYYTDKELKILEEQVKFDSFAHQIHKHKKKEWLIPLKDDILIRMYSHELFNRGIPTGENSCWTEVLEVINKNNN